MHDMYASCRKGAAAIFANNASLPLLGRYIRSLSNSSVLVRNACCCSLQFEHADMDIHIQAELETAFRHAVSCISCLEAVARSAQRDSMLAQDSGGAALDIRLTLDAYNHLWPTRSH